MPLLKEETYTIDDIYALPEGKRAELIDGHMYMMAPPSRKHQKISMELSSIIREYIRSHKGKCEVYAAPFAVYLEPASVHSGIFVHIKPAVVTCVIEESSL